MKILGLNLGYMATAAILVDGKLEACISQERFSRRKNDEAYPKDAIEFCLNYANIKNADDLDFVAIGSEMPDLWHRLTRYYSSFSIKDRLEEQYKYWKPVLYEDKKIAWHSLYQDRLDLKQYPGNWNQLIDQLSDSYYMTDEDQKKVNQHIRETIANHLKIDTSKILFIDHHSAHAAYAYYASPFREEDTLVLTLDAFGDGNSASISIGRKGTLVREKAISHKDFQIARIYRYITLLMGMKPDEHEYKVMGLAPYAKPQIYEKAYKIFKDTMYVDGLDFKFKETPKDMYFYFREKLEGIRFDGIAAGLQLFVEDIIVEWVKNVIATYKIQNLVFAGGVCMNIKALQKVADLPEVKNLHIPPSPGDDSLCMGAAYFLHGEKSNLAINPLESGYLGSDISEKEIEEVLNEAIKKGYKVSKNVSASYVAKKLSSGRVLGRCAGRMEFGARALGNRSILADPRSNSMIRKINEKIKNRDFWMPFAPAILSEKISKYLKNPKGLISKYMTLGFDTIEETRESIIAGLHPADFTARPQFVFKDQNPEYHELISEFEKITNVACLLNTSFNLHGEPIVRNAQDAYRVFELTDIDDLLLNNVLISK